MAGTEERTVGHRRAIGTSLVGLLMAFGVLFAAAGAAGAATGTSAAGAVQQVPVCEYQVVWDYLAIREDHFSSADVVEVKRYGHKVWATDTVASGSGRRWRMLSTNRWAIVDGLARTDRPCIF